MANPCGLSFTFPRAAFALSPSSPAPSPKTSTESVAAAAAAAAQGGTEEGGEGGDDGCG